ncbi:MAG TPA: acyl-CoA dehydrogenase [Burkholderiaceae bacterium]|nr:acyl-CoA dehydrogenase [Burkholderiaceae bacterium]
MDFSLSEEQSMLVSSCERLVRERCTFEARRRDVRADPATPPPAWGDMVELGLAALCVPASAGGLGLAPIDAALVAQALGGGWLLEPYVDSALAAAATLAAAPASAARDAALQRVAAGAIVVPLREATYEGGALRAASPHAAYAESLLAFVDGRLLLFAAAATSRRAYRQFDGTSAAHVEAAAAEGVALAQGDAAERAWRAGAMLSTIGRVAEGVGLARTVVAVTTDYLRTRKQFGQPIGRFQVLAHRTADMLILLEQAQSLAWAAAMNRDERTIDAAQVMAHRALRTIGQQAVQLHGGIGMADETPVSHYVKRLLGIEIELGDVDTVLTRFSRRES